MSKKKYKNIEDCDTMCGDEEGLDYYEDVMEDDDIDGLSDNSNWEYWMGMGNEDVEGGSARLKRIGKRWTD